LGGNKRDRSGAREKKHYKVCRENRKAAITEKKSKKKEKIKGEKGDY